MFYKVLVNSVSDIGYVRQNNEDSWKLLNEAHFYALADGMGGHQAGEIASKEAVDRLCALFQKRYTASKSLKDTKDELEQIIQEVNASIFRMGLESVALRGMGTTLCCVFLHPKGLIYAHVGDSRIYRFREGHLVQLTQDHSLLQELIDTGQIAEDQSKDFLYKNIITKAIGTDSVVEPTIKDTSIEVGDIILMCTDGLSDLVNLKNMQEIILENSEEDFANLLVEKAKFNGGYDNITVIVIRIENIYETNLSRS